MICLRKWKTYILKRHFFFFQILLSYDHVILYIKILIKKTIVLTSTIQQKKIYWRKKNQKQNKTIDKSSKRDPGINCFYEYGEKKNSWKNEKWIKMTVFCFKKNLIRFRKYIALTNFSCWLLTISHPTDVSPLYSLICLFSFLLLKEPANPPINMSYDIFRFILSIFSSLWIGEKVIIDFCCFEFESISKNQMPIVSQQNGLKYPWEMCRSENSSWGAQKVSIQFPEIHSI